MWWARLKGEHPAALVLVVLAIVALFLAPMILPPFYVRIGQMLFFSSGLALAWGILGGFCGYWSFGHTAFIGLGAFAAGLMATHFSFGGPTTTLIVGVIFGGAFSGGFALLIAYPLLRLRGIYFAIAMLGVSLVLSELSLSVDFFEGAMGISLPVVGPRSMAPEVFFYYLFLGCAVGTLIIAYAIRYSRLGYGLLSIREDEDTAMVLGVPTEGYKIAVFVISATIVGVFGALYAYSLGFFTSTSVFRIDFSLHMLIYSLLGGIGTLLGPIIGVVVMVILTQVVLGNLLEIHMLVTGVLIIVIVMVAPGGILGFLQRRPRQRDRTVEPEAKTVVAPGPPVLPGEAEPILSIRGLTKSFRGLVAVNRVSIDIPKGSICSIIGPNGAGKSTLFNLITGYLQSDEGDILYRGEAIGGTKPYLINRRGIARAFQISKPFQGLSVFENIMVGALFGKEGERDALRVANVAVKRAGLHAQREQLASSLTVGDLRKLELARAIATRPDLLLADEPCAGLNPSETQEVIAILDEIRRQGTTVVLIEHDMTAVMQISDYIFVIEAGVNIAEGVPDDVSNNPRVIEAYLGKPIDGEETSQ